MIIVGAGVVDPPLVAAFDQAIGRHDHSAVPSAWRADRNEAGAVRQPLPIDTVPAEYQLDIEGLRVFIKMMQQAPVDSAVAKGGHRVEALGISLVGDEDAGRHGVPIRPQIPARQPRYRPRVSLQIRRCF